MKQTYKFKLALPIKYSILKPMLKKLWLMKFVGGCAALTAMSTVMIVFNITSKDICNLRIRKADFEVNWIIIIIWVLTECFKYNSDDSKRNLKPLLLKTESYLTTQFIKTKSVDITM